MKLRTGSFEAFVRVGWGSDSLVRLKHEQSGRDGRAHLSRSVESTRLV